MSDAYFQYQQLRAKELASTNAFDLNQVAFKQQLEFINDPHRLKSLFCTRRAAKSFTGGLYLIKTALENPGCNCLFIGLTRQSAHGIIWKDILRELDTRYKLNIKFNETLLTATLPNGSVIWVTGADTDEQEMNKLLGKKYKLVILDEASMFTVNVHQMVYGVLKPATADQRGTICLLGTSSNITRGLFYDITTLREPGWALHTWTAHDNPHVAEQWREELEDIAKNRPLFMETPLFKQWYLNQWVIDEDALVYKYNDSNFLPSLPYFDSPYSYILGVDLGHSPDPSAFVVGAYTDSSPNLFIIHAEKHIKYDVTDVANKVKELEMRYKFDVKVVDNANAQAVAELNNRHGTNLVPADKQGKEHFINIMNAEFIQRKIFVLPGAKELADEYKSLVWETDNGIVKKSATGLRREHPGLPNHLCDASLYLWRHCHQYLFTQAPIAKHIDWNKQEEWEPKHIEKMAEQVKEQQNPNGWSNLFKPDEDLFSFDEDGVI